VVPTKCKIGVLLYFNDLVTVHMSSVYLSALTFMYARYLLDQETGVFA